MAIWLYPHVFCAESVKLDASTRVGMHEGVGLLAPINICFIFGKRLALIGTLQACDVSCELRAANLPPTVLLIV